MTKYDDFIATARECGERFLEHSRDEQILVVGHIDTDGICAVAILTDALQKQGYKVTNTHVQHINEEVIKVLQDREEKILCFADIGSSFLDDIATLKEKEVYVFDHHEPKGTLADFVTQVNPISEGIDENDAISGSGVAYFFSIGLHPDNKKLAHIAVIGALGDTQLNNEIRPLNNRVLQYATLQKTIRVGRRLRLHGIYSRPLTKILEYSADLDIPGVTNNPEGVLDLLDELRIPTDWNDRPRKFYQLSTDEKKALTRKIIELKDDEDVFVPTYSLADEDFKPLRDLREFATVLNACGRLEVYKVGVDALLGKPEAKETALATLKKYKSALWEAMQYVKNNQDDVLKGDGYMIINFKNTLKTSIAGIVASMLARNKQYERGTIMCTMARGENDQTKISLRVSHDTPGKQLNKVLESVVEPLGAQAGGHDNAAGAVINTKDEEQFVASLQEALAKV